MALREKEVVGKSPSVSGRLGVFFRTYRSAILVAGVVLTAVAVAVAIKEGLRRNCDQTASALFSHARTVEDYRAILAKVPGSYLTFAAWMNIGNLLVAQDKSEKTEEAAQQFERALQCSKPGFQRASALCALGMISAQRKEISKACDYFGRAVASEPRGVKASEALTLWGRCLEVSGDKAGAKSKFREATLVK